MPPCLIDTDYIPFGRKTPSTPAPSPSTPSYETTKPPTKICPGLICMFNAELRIFVKYQNVYKSFHLQKKWDYENNGDYTLYYNPKL